MFVLHARLRNNAAVLIVTFFRNHIRYNPLCDLYDVVEDASKFFFQCRKYSVERQAFNATIRGFQPLNINVILYGNENWNNEFNVVLFRAAHICVYPLQNAFNCLL